MVDLDDFRDVLFSSIVPASEVAAIFVEPIQGEGGYVIPEDGFLQGLREICDEHGILLSAKGHASGMPLSALAARASLLKSWDTGAHGSTYSGNLVACAAALVTLRLLRDGLMENAMERREQGLRELRALGQAHPRLIEAAHGVGLMLAIRLA